METSVRDFQVGIEGYTKALHEASLCHKMQSGVWSRPEGVVECEELYHA